MQLPVNKIVKASREGRQSYGMYVRSPSKKMVEMMASAGMDFVRFDMEGGVYDLESLGNMILFAHGAGLTPVVRVNRLDAQLIGQVLSLGAMGVILPEITGHKDVEYGVRAAKLAPIGERAGAGTLMGGYGFTPADTYVNWADENIFLSVQMETKEACDDLDAILAVPGLDMVQSGRGTLSGSLGLPGQQFHPDVVALEEKVMKKGMAAGKMTSVHYYPMRDETQLDFIRKYEKMGVTCISLGIDNDIIAVLQRLIAGAKQF